MAIGSESNEKGKSSGTQLRQVMSATAKKGLKIRRQLVGTHEVDRKMKEIENNDFLQKFNNYTNETCFAGVWGRPGLDNRTRNMLPLAIMAALGQASGMEAIIRRALRGGVTRDEIAEVFLHVYSYAGMHASWSAFGKANETFRMIDEDDVEV